MNCYRFGLARRRRVWLLPAALVFMVGCAAAPPTPRPSIAGIQKVLLVGFPGRVYDDRGKKRSVIDLAANRLATATDFEVQVEPRDILELQLIRWREDEPCLTFKMPDPDETAAVDPDRVMTLAREKQVDAVMIGALRLYPARGTEARLALGKRQVKKGKVLDILEDAESDVILEAILVGADGSCRWHGKKETSLSVDVGLKSLATFGMSYRDEVAYDRIDRGLTYLFMTLPKPERAED